MSDAPPLRHGRLVWAGLATATVLTIVIGLFPGPLLEIVGEAARTLPAPIIVP